MAEKYYRLNCKCGKSIIIDTSKLDVKNKEFRKKLLARFGVATFEELSRIYKCRSCRSEKPLIRNVTQQQISDAKVMKLKLTGNGSRFDLVKYNNFYVGFEFEFDCQMETLQTVAQNFGVKVNKTLGIIKRPYRVALADGTGFDVPIQENAYEKAGIVTQVYHDGSVGGEVVTRPLHYLNLSKAKEVFDYLKSNENCKLKTKKAGLHMTFLLDWHKEHSDFDVRVVQNIIQIIRYYYRPIVLMNKQTTRGTNYRIIPSFDYVKDPIKYNSHHFAAAIRAENRKIWGIEIRIPDGTDNWNIIEQQVLFYSALIRHAAKIAKEGLIYIPQDHWNKQYEFYQTNISELSVLQEHDEDKKLQTDLLKRLELDLKYLSKEDNYDVTNMYEHERDVANATVTQTSPEGH